MNDLRWFDVGAQRWGSGYAYSFDNNGNITNGDYGRNWSFTPQL